MRVALLAIGDEILRGDTQDTNSSFLARSLASRGAVLCRILTIPDELELIAEEVARHSAEYDRVITTGGIGPTPDDLTREAVARAFGRELVLFEDVAREWSERRGTDLNEGQLTMCTLPEGARLIPVRSSGAPGFIVGNVYVLAGVPVVMREMWEGIAHEFSGRLRTVGSFTVHMPESQFAAVLRDFQDRHSSLDFGSYPRMEGEWHTEIKVIGVDRELVIQVCDELEQAVRKLDS